MRSEKKLMTKKLEILPEFGEGHGIFSSQETYKNIQRSNPPPPPPPNATQKVRRVRL